MSFSIISSNLGGPVGVSYSFTSHLDKDDTTRPTIGLNIHHLNQGPGGSSPVMVCIHGGGWFAGDKNNFEEYKPKFFNELGMIFVNINYRLCRPYSTTNDNVYADWDVNRVKFPVPVQDCANALKWVQDNISDYGGDPNNINLIGHSSGAHLALLLATNTDYINAVGVPTSSIKSCTAIDTTFLNISNSISDSDSTEGNAPLLCRNAFGVEYDAGRSGGFNDFSSTSEQNDAYNAGSPDQHVSSGIVTNFLLCIQGDTDRRNKMIAFRDSLQTAGIGNSLCLFFSGAGANSTYTHEEFHEYIGAPTDKPDGAYVPTQNHLDQGHSDVGISTFISRYLHQIGVIDTSKTFTFDVGHSGSSNYTFTGYDRNNSFTSASNSTLNVNVGDTLVFNVDASGHPFYLKTTVSTGTGDQVSTGTITNNGEEVGTVTWDTTGVAQGTYYYNCQNHGSMNGIIYVNHQL